MALSQKYNYFVINFYEPVANRYDDHSLMFSFREYCLDVRNKAQLPKDITMLNFTPPPPPPPPKKKKKKNNYFALRMDEHVKQDTDKNLKFIIKK